MPGHHSGACRATGPVDVSRGYDAGLTTRYRDLFPGEEGGERWRKRGLPVRKIREVLRLKYELGLSYRKIAAATKLGIILQGNISLPLLEQLVGIESIVAMKEDVSEKYYFDIARKFGRRLSIFCGGQKWRFLVGRPYGSTGYLSTFGTFAPTIATRFWQAVERNDMTRAYEIVLKYDQPLFDFCLAGPRSFNAYWHAILEHFKVASRYLRPPEESCRRHRLHPGQDRHDTSAVDLR